MTDHSDWEFFQDEGYFGMWCVREKDARRFGEGFHTVSKEEAEALASALSSQSLSLSEAMEEIERLKGLVAGIREAQEPAFDLVSHLERQRAWSAKTFGPGTRTLGVLDHIRKELSEIEADPADVKEWVDVIILAFDGAWRAGWEPTEVVKAMVAKQTKNEARNWPDWRTSSPDKAIEHVRGHND